MDISNYFYYYVVLKLLLLPHFTVIPIFAIDVADPILDVETESEERNHAVSSP